MKASDRTHYQVTFRSEGQQTVPEPIRLRHLLKGMLRALGFRCVEIKELPPVPKSAPADAAGKSK